MINGLAPAILLILKFRFKIAVHVTETTVYSEQESALQARWSNQIQFM
jgi:hypothetical protein